MSFPKQEPIDGDVTSVMEPNITYNKGRESLTLRPVSRSPKEGTRTPTGRMRHITTPGRERMRETAKLRMREIRRRRKQFLYEFMVAQSGGATCAICGEADSRTSKADGFKHRLHVDHDHSTGLVRDLLCSRCNTAIGQLRENPEIIRRAAAYIEHHLALPSDLVFSDEMVEPPTGTVHPFNADVDGLPLSDESLAVPVVDALRHVQHSAVGEVEARPQLHVPMVLRGASA